MDPESQQHQMLLMFKRKTIMLDRIIKDMLEEPHKELKEKDQSRHKSGPIKDSNDEVLSKRPAHPKSAFDCSLCQVQCSSQVTLSTHLEGKQHKKKLESASRGVNSMFRCEVCDVETTDQNGLDMHMNGKKHLKKVNAKKI